MTRYLPPSMHTWINPLSIALSIALILLVAWLLRLLMRRLLARLGRHYTLPGPIELAIRRLFNFIIGSVALVVILDRLNVDAKVLWTAFTGFAAVGAVAFFAAWSVLSNIFCTFLIFTTRPFRLGDQIELLENGEKPGLKGRVHDINLIYTTLHEIGGPAEGTLMQIPNSLFFQRGLRRWRHGDNAQDAIEGDG
ncbi:mechanosensitive ion channel family protein [Stenotrophomonas sp. SY1]|uniref:mechanosensitive ion channel domain-containing protein n=1 Tax=Stenotrophomonas sp. SY1 TaxID=477235 RepID=UPI001E3542F2|nr:mechanosensitive ion channel family protein [Stenotrophomonas sp. SY1]MCD9087451.1 mechanosensitive ion channel family protein [Stenotrophomonas sp. SY1]